MSENVSRREFLQDSALVTGGVALTGAMTPQLRAAEASQSFSSRWDDDLDRPWLGAEYWANRLQDWRVANGRIECITAERGRDVHLLTRQLSDQPGTLNMSVRLGPANAKSFAQAKGSAGFAIGVQGPLSEYRNNAIFGNGLNAGMTTDGQLFIGNPQGGKTFDADRGEIELRLSVDANGKVILSAHDADGKELASVERTVPAANLTGNITLSANYRPAAKKVGNGTFWFSDWKLSGTRLLVRDEHAFGPILFTHYAVSNGTMKLAAQMPPLGPDDNRTVQLHAKQGNSWELLGEAEIHPQARTATFRVDDWDASHDRDYRVAYAQRTKSGERRVATWSGTFRRDPVDRPVLTIGDVSCNIHAAFPNPHYTENMAALNPDFLAFVGDQFYESSGGFGVQRAPLEPAILDYLRKWYLHGWTWRELTKDRPSISIPDDHDVYQGNLWGEGGAPQTISQEAGGYNMPPEWVNVVHHTQTSHHPDPWDNTPCKQGITVYSGPLVYGGVSFAILADRQFKTGPEGEVPPTGIRPDHVPEGDWDPATADLPGLQLLSERQLEPLKDWVTNWTGAEMKAIISQTIFTGMATTHGTEAERLAADYDTNAWPQTERNQALREIRKAFAFHISGDQHLPAVVHYGIDEHGDAGIAFAGPPVNTGYPRWFEPREPGKNRKPGAPYNTGEFIDCFGHPMTVLAVADGKKEPRKPVLERLHDKVSGLGLVQFDKSKRTITVSCWPFLADPTKPGTQFPGWPLTFGVLENYGRKAAAHLPHLQVDGVEQPVVTVRDAQGETVYSLRLKEPNWQPFVFEPGKYDVIISEPESGREKTLAQLAAEPNNTKTVTVSL